MSFAAAFPESSQKMSGKLEPINILFVLPSFGTGGSEKLVVDIIRNLDPARFRPVLAVFFSGQYEEMFRTLEFPFYVIHKDRELPKWQVAKLLSDIVRAHNIDIVNTHHPSPLIQGLIPFRIFHRISWVHTEHTRLNLEAAISKHVLVVSRWCLKAVDVCVGISRGVCEYLETDLGVPPNRTRKVINGVDLNRFALPGFDPRSFKQELVSGEDTILLGMFANFRPQKNHLNLVRAIGLLKSRVAVKFQLLLCGEGQTLPEVEALIEELGLESHIQLLGPRFDIPQLMNTIDIYCLTSLYEGLPLSLLEAMACRRAIVATNVPGNDEVIVDGRNGLFCASDDPEDLAQKVERLLTDATLRASLGAHAFETAQELSFQNMMRDYESLFCEVCEEP